MSIERIGRDRIQLIREIALETWPVTFGEILSKEQIAYMLEMMYNENVLLQQLDSGHEFYLFLEDGEALGFMGIEPNYKGNSQIKIHKLYVLPKNQGKGIGEDFIAFAEKRCMELNCVALTLNVNRLNKAIYFYEKLDFITTKTEDIDIGNGYLMEDFVMEKRV